MFRWAYLSGALLSSAAALGVAQTTATRPTDPVFVRAQALVSDGNGVAGRALVDSVLKATPPTAPLYPEALFWRATLASNAADAESDYKHIVVDYPLAPQAENALLRLAQLELARGDRDGALAHLQRIPRDYPRSKSLARASYWTARVLFEKNDIPNACAANANALSQAGAAEIELRNQIQYQGQRCPMAPAVVAAVPPAANAPTNNPPTPTSASSTPRNVGDSSVSPAPPTNQIKAIPPAPTPVTTPAKSEKVVAVDTVSTTVAVAAPSKPTIPAAQQERPKPPTEANDAKPSIVDPTKPLKPAPSKATTTRNPASSGASGYSVQVAAYNHKPDAEKLASSLTTRGYSARVDGSVAPFRVRIGRYATNKEAEAALKRIKAKHMEGFVTRAPER